MSRRRSIEITSMRNNSAHSRQNTNFNYGNTTGVFKFDPIPVSTTNGSRFGASGNRITIKTVNGVGTRSSGQFNMTNLKSNLPKVNGGNGYNGRNSSVSTRMTTNNKYGTSSGSQLHPNDYKAIQYMYNLPTKFNMATGGKSHTR